MQGLMGDSTDNIPGVPGVGEKTAAKLIQQFGTLENLFEHLDEVKAGKLREKLSKNRESAFMSRDLARLRSEAEVGLEPEDLTPAEADNERLRDLYQTWEFTRFLDDLGPVRTVSREDYHLLSGPDQLAILEEELSWSGTVVGGSGNDLGGHRCGPPSWA